MRDGERGTDTWLQSLLFSQPAFLSRYLSDLFAPLFVICSLVTPSLLFISQYTRFPLYDPPTVSPQEAVSPAVLELGAVNGYKIAPGRCLPRPQG